MARLTCILILMTSLVYSQQTLHVMSFNLRYNTERDGDNAWPHRTGLVESMIRYHGADLIGVQEAVKNQMEDLAHMLPDFDSHGVGRDLSEGTEYSAIWYRKNRLEFLDGATFWLSETPDQMSQGWDAALNRIVTWAKFRDRWTGKVFFHFNTHFDHRGEVARRESARLLLQRIQELNPDKYPVVVTGDFNATPDSEPYQVLTQSKEFPVVRDSWIESIIPPHGPSSTWSGFTLAGHPDRRIDYVFVQQEVHVLRVASLAESWSGRFPSDHLPVLAEVLISPIKPLPQAHAHNDYEHDRPLFDALDHGFTSVEADVWLLEGELYVSHNKPGQLTEERSLRKLYLDPLAKRIIHGKGNVYPGSKAPFWLMIDLKNEGEASFRAILEELKPYSWMLKGSTPAVRIFLSGARPVNLMLQDQQTLVGIDGRPDHLGKGYDAAKMPVISQRYGKIISWRGNGPIPDKDFRTLKALADQAHAEGKRVRLWASPEKELVWETLLKAGIDLVNTDKLADLQEFLLRNQANSAK